MKKIEELDIINRIMALSEAQFEELLKLFEG